MTRASLLLLLPALLLGGCISLLPKPPPPPRLFVLEVGQVDRAQGEPIDAVIGISEPNGERTLLAQQLVWRTSETLAFVAQSQWSGRAGEGLQSMLVQTLSRQNRFRAAVRSGEARSDYEIRWEVLDFEVVESDMKAHFSAQVTLVAPGRRVVASELISTEAPVSDRSSSIAAEALTRAAREGSARIGLFAADAAAQAQAQAAEADQARAASINR